jgi:hypothetical protein
MIRSHCASSKRRAVVRAHVQLFRPIQRAWKTNLIEDEPEVVPVTAWGTVELDVRPLGNCDSQAGHLNDAGEFLDPPLMALGAALTGRPEGARGFTLDQRRGPRSHSFFPDS